MESDLITPSSVGLLAGLSTLAIGVWVWLRQGLTWLGAAGVALLALDSLLAGFGRPGAFFPSLAVIGGALIVWDVARRRKRA